MSNIEYKSIIKYYVPLSLGIAFVISGFMLFPLLFIGIILIIISIKGRKIRNSSCKECDTWGDVVKTYSDEIIDKDEERKFYVEHVYTEGTIVMPDVIPSSKFESKNYSNTNGSTAGPHIYQGKTVTTQTNYRREKWCSNKFRLVDYTDVSEKHLIRKKCIVCGNITEEVKYKKYRINNIDNKLGKYRNTLDDELMEYIKNGYPFVSNDPELNGVSYEDLLNAKNYAKQKGFI